MRSAPVITLLLLACGGSKPLASSPEPAPTTEPTIPAKSSAEAIVRAYLAATAKADLIAAGELVIEQSIVFESGGDEGTWHSYRDHHLGPELKQFKTFEIRPGKISTVASADGSLALVTLALDYDIGLEGGRTIESSGTVTFALTVVEGKYRIQHIHWSSRRRKSAAH